MEASGPLHASEVLPWGEIPGTYYIKGWVGPRADLGVMENKVPFPNQTPTSRPSSP
jgi:hypothetical protein